MRQTIVAGNWKMNGSKESIHQLLNVLKQNSEQLESQLIVFPPFVYLEQAATELKGTRIALGAQNLSHYDDGAHTGEVAASMLQEFACRYVLVGHSERRTLYAENNDLVAKKFAQAKRYDITPILCVGETQFERQAEKTFEVISQQLSAIMNTNENAFQNALIAYEPVWAIGTGLTATPDQAQQVHQFIRQFIAKSNHTIAQQTPILYGGSVKAKNAQELFAMPDIDGGLVGGASLDAPEFLEIAKR